MISVPNLIFNSSGYAELKGHKVQLRGYLILRKYIAIHWVFLFATSEKLEVAEEKILVSGEYKYLF